MQIESLPANNRWLICAASGKLPIATTPNLLIIYEISNFYEKVLDFLILSIPFSLYTAHISKSRQRILWFQNVICIER